ncbi:hypothetical protein A6E15_02325 [Natrinema saccharevitans]|uniref:Uncharacterized protein n=1 Tax=Natrinema saccharevitans TaxID=301967 RepID=A0A1S8ATH4_9EURY|nr:hypothetical protein [Natrinema saccharevitans]OLZ39886.1 hypothetical protein A6E15_02325 [Natrinema saccharevitans]
MTDDDGDGDDRERAATDDADTPPTGIAGAVPRLRRDPALLVPFTVAGLVLALLDRLRRWDPIPTQVTGDDVSIGIEYAGYPTGVPDTVRSLGALVDLKLPYLVWAIGLEALALAVVAAAGTVTIARTLAIGDGWDRPRWRRRWLAYLGLIVLFDAVGRVVGSLGDVGLVFGAVLAVPLFAAFVRFFLAPAFVVTGSGPVTALTRSARATRGIGWRLLALVVCFGLAAWLLGLVPFVGTALSTALVGSMLAVTMATVRDGRYRDGPVAAGSG